MFKRVLKTGLINPVFFCLTSLIPLSPAAQATPLPTAQISVGGTKVNVEIAATDSSRSQGLMHRRELPDDQGMLFVFPTLDNYCFWMKNTPLPLTIAFIDEEGVILNLADMTPYSEEAHCPAWPIGYALEMKRGWFASHGISPGATLGGLPKRQSP